MIVQIVDQRPIIEVVDNRPVVTLTGAGPQGTQGIAGVQNVIVSTEEPTEVFEDLIWIQPL